MFFRLKALSSLAFLTSICQGFCCFVFKGKLSCNRADLDEGGGETYALNN